MIGNGLVDYVCLDNLFSFDKYKSDILFHEKFKIVGDIEYHQSILQKKILNTIDNDLPNIIISLPQLAEHFILGWQEIYFILDELMQIFL